MENRHRDKISKNTGQKKSDSSAEFGEKVGQSENIEREPSRSSDKIDSGVRYRGGNRGGNSESL